MSKPLSLEAIFKGRHFDAEIHRAARPFVSRL
jgi:hypothetical protein